MNIYQLFNKPDPGYCCDYRPITRYYSVKSVYRDGYFWHDFCYRKQVVFSYNPDTNRINFDYSTFSLYYFYVDPDINAINKFCDKFIPGCTYETIQDLFNEYMEDSIK